jgi:hypothetical protein
MSPSDPELGLRDPACQLLYRRPDPRATPRIVRYAYLTCVATRRGPSIYEVGGHLPDGGSDLRQDWSVEKWTDYLDTRFRTEVLEDAARAFEARLPEEDDERPVDEGSTLQVTIGQDRWSFDSLDEFFAEHRKPHTSSHLVLWGDGVARQLSVGEYGNDTVVSISFPDRVDITVVSAVFERKADEARLPPPPPMPQPKPVVFIGHGRSQEWRDLKDHLHDQHGYDVQAYETGARAGHTIRDILQDMVRSSSFAVLVMTGEDETSEGRMRARQNVVHETGLFQGALGSSRAVVLVEEDVEDYSNLQGIHQIRYSAGKIKETYGEVLATLRREFGRQ